MPSPVKITTAANANAINGSGERVLDRDRAGRLWVGILDGADDFRPWYSKNEGTTWSFSGSDSEVDDALIRDSAAWMIDSDGYAHAVVRDDNTHLKYARGTPGSNGVTWNWKKMDFAPSTEALAPGSGVAIVAFRVGSSWKAWILAGTTLRDGAGNYTNTLRLTRIDISSTGGMSVGNVQTIRTSTGGSYPHGSLAFQHTGDGKTATATPHIYVTSGVNTPDTSQQRQDPVQLVKLTFESGAWTTGSAVTIEASTDTTGRTLRSIYDGARVVTAYGTRNRTTGTSSAAIHVADWDEASGTVTRRDPPAYGGGYPLGTTLAVDPISDDLWVVAYGETVDDPVWVRYNRSAGTWGTWAVVASVNMGGKPGRVSLKPYVSSSAIDLVYMSGAASPYTISYIKLTSINQAPATPTLLAPAPSSINDLGTYGVTFSWQFNDPDPGDSQSAWQMRRKTTGSYTYLTDATSTWGATPVWNTGSVTSRVFPAGAWPNGSTYQWSVNTQDTGGLASGFAPDATVIATVSPVVTVTAPVAAYSEDSSPVVTWNYVSSLPQRTYQLRLFDIATYSAGGFDPATSAPVWDSGDTASVLARSVRIGVSLLNGGTYRAFMRVSDSNALYSQWAYSEFVLILTPAPAPALEVVEESNYLTGLKRVRLTIQGSTNLLSGSQAYDHSTTATDWDVVSNATIAQDTSGAGAATVAGRSLRMTSVAAGPMSIRSANGVASLDTTGVATPPARDFAAIPFQTYTAVGSFTSGGAPRLARLSLQFYSSSDSLLLTIQGNTVADLPNFPTQVSVTGDAPLGANRVRLLVEVLDSASGENHYVDRLDLHPGDGIEYSPGGLAPTQTFTVTRTVGATSTVVRTASAVLPDASQRLLTFDREMPFGVEATYTAQAITVLTTGQGLASDPSSPATIQIDSEVWAVRDPLVPDSEARALVVEHETETLELLSVYRPSGRSLPLVETEGVQGEDASKMVIFVDTIADRQNLRGLIRNTSTLLVQSPSGDFWYVHFGDRKKTAGYGLGQSWELTYVEVAAP